MLTEKLWRATRRLVPVELYPLLAPVHRWRRRRRLRQLQDDDRRYLAEHPGLRVPPAELRYNVVGPCTIPEFLRGGQQTARDIQSALKTVGASLDRYSDFLDFGCGCGRVILALQDRNLRLRIAGCDVDRRAIDWCRQNLPCAEVLASDPLPPSPFRQGAFDLVWAGSVFTHLDEERQDRWLDELRRILKPRGVLLASVHGPHCWEPRLPSWTVAKLKRKGMLFVRTGADAGIHPDWYQVAWHTEEYLRAHWARVFEVRSYIPRGFNDEQDLVVAQKSV